MSQRQWPSKSEYGDALWSPRWAFVSEELRAAAFEPHPHDPNSLIHASGSFATVAKATFAGRSWAVRCLTSQQDDVVRRYGEIRAVLERIPDHVLKVRTFDDEIRVSDEGIRYPIIAVEWFEGVGLGAFIATACAAGDTGSIESVRAALREMSSSLMLNGIVHGDVSPDNILVRADRGSVGIKLVDYDSMWAAGTALEQFRTHVGIGPLKHRRTPAQLDVLADVPAFLVMDLVLAVLSVEPDLAADPESFDGGRFACSASDIESGLGAIAEAAMRLVPSEYDFVRECLIGPYQHLPGLPWIGPPPKARLTVFDAALYIGCSSSDVLRRCVVIWPGRAWDSDSELDDDEWRELTGESASGISRAQVSDLASVPDWIVGLILDSDDRTRRFSVAEWIGEQDLDVVLTVLLEWKATHTSDRLLTIWADSETARNIDFHAACAMVGVHPDDLAAGIVSPDQWRALISYRSSAVAPADEVTGAADLAAERQWPAAAVLVASSTALGRPIGLGTTLAPSERDSVVHLLDMWTSLHLQGAGQSTSQIVDAMTLSEAALCVGLSPDLVEAGRITPAQHERLVHYARRLVTRRAAPPDRSISGIVHPVDTSNDHDGGRTIRSVALEDGCSLSHVMAAATHFGIRVSDPDEVVTESQARDVSHRISQWRLNHSLSRLRDATGCSDDAVLLAAAEGNGVQFERLVVGDLTPSEFDRLIESVRLRAKSRSTGRDETDGRSPEVTQPVVPAVDPEEDGSDERVSFTELLQSLPLGKYETDSALRELARRAKITCREVERMTTATATDGEKLRELAAEAHRHDCTVDEWFERSKPSALRRSIESLVSEFNLPRSDLVAVLLSVGITLPATSPYGVLDDDSYARAVKRLERRRRRARR